MPGKEPKMILWKNLGGTGEVVGLPEGTRPKDKGGTWVRMDEPAPTPPAPKAVETKHPRK